MVDRIFFHCLFFFKFYCHVPLQFGEESKHLTCLNSFIIECHEMMKAFFRECCMVEELEEHFSVHEFTEATLISRPILYISLQVMYLYFGKFI